MDKKGTVHTTAPAPDVASVVVAPKHEAPPKKKQKLSAPVDATTVKKFVFIDTTERCCRRPHSRIRHV